MERVCLQSLLKEFLQSLLKGLVLPDLQGFYLLPTFVLLDLCDLEPLLQGNGLHEILKPLCKGGSKDTLVKGVFGSIPGKGRTAKQSLRQVEYQKNKLLLGLALGSPKRWFRDKPCVFGGIIKVWVSTLLFFGC